MLVTSDASGRRPLLLAMVQVRHRQQGRKRGFGLVWDHAVAEGA